MEPLVGRLVHDPEVATSLGLGTGQFGTGDGTDRSENRNAVT